MSSKKGLKQFQIVDKDSCIIYLTKIIGTVDMLLQRLKVYNEQFKKLVDNYSNSNAENVPVGIYYEMSDKVSSIEDYTLNIIGDCQNTSISYFKYRKQIERLIKAGVKDIHLCNLEDETKQLLNQFNMNRNWQNHIPESLLTSEISLLDEKSLQDHPANPINVVYHNYVTFNYFKDLYINSMGFYQETRTMHQVIKRDYSALIGEHVNIQRIYTDEALDLESLQAAKMSADIQGLK